MKASSNHSAADAASTPSKSATSKGHAKKQATKSTASSSHASSSTSKSKKNASSSTAATLPAVATQASAPSAANAAAAHAGVAPPVVAGAALDAGAANSAATTTATGANVGREKNLPKTYAGLHAKSIKTIWEQYDRHDTELHPDALTRLADDATYKLWELGNNLKTYARHSGGLVTVDGVNEVLKDMDVPPVIGAGGTHWDHVDHDGTVYFPFDEVLELRDEYLREVNTSQCGPLRLVTAWKLDKQASPSLNTFSKALCIAIISGDEETFGYALHVALLSPHVGCVLRSLLRFCLKILMFEYTDETLDRVLRLLAAVVRNGYARDCTTHEDQLYHLGQLLVCMVLGPLDLNVGLAEFKRDVVDMRRREYEIDSIAKELQLSVVKEEVPSVVGAAAVVTPLPIAMDVDDIHSECEALLQMMEGFEATADSGAAAASKVVKIESVTPPKSSLVKQETIDSPKFDVKSVKLEPETLYDEELIFNPNTDTTSSHAKTPNMADGDDDEEMPQSASSQQPNTATPNTNHCNTAVPAVDNECAAPVGPADTTIPESFSTLTTVKCTDARLDEVLAVIGGMASKWGYFESEVVYLVVKRMEIFFLGVNEATMLDYEWLIRLVQLLWTLGDYAFRELSAHFAQIDTMQSPERIQYYFNATAIFLRGRDDIFVYEYLSDLCGDGLTPFMVYYTKYAERHSQRLKRRQDARRAAALSMPPRLLLRTLPRPDIASPTSHATPNHQRIGDLFPHRVLPNLTHPRIGFAFAGCTPIVPNPKITTSAPSAAPPVNTGDRVIVCRRRLLRPRLDSVDRRGATYELRRLCL